MWLNGRELGRHESGYTPFELDASAAARPGRNVVAVLVDDRLSRHEDSPAHGLAETPAVVGRDYHDLKLLNEVLTRPVHYPQSKLVLDYADRHGILLIPEVPAWQLTREQMANPRMQALERQQLRELVESEANHPSVIAWSVGNELDSQTVEGWRFVRRAIACVKELGPTRPVGFASNHLYETPQLDATRFSDFVEINEYAGSWGGPESELAGVLDHDHVHAAFPGKPVIVSEFGLEPHWYALPGSPGPPDASHDSDYYSGFVMGVVDRNRGRRGSWRLLRREYAPVVVDGVSADASGVRVRLRARSNLPSYTLRSYTLRWALRGATGTALAQGSALLPDLPPGAHRKIRVSRLRVSTHAVLVIDVIRPTGFSALSGVYRVVESGDSGVDRSIARCSDDVGLLHSLCLMLRAATAASAT